MPTENLGPDFLAFVTYFSNIENKLDDLTINQMKLFQMKIHNAVTLNINWSMCMCVCGGDVPN